VRLASLATAALGPRERDEKGFELFKLQVPGDEEKPGIHNRGVYPVMAARKKGRKKGTKKAARKRARKK
jgi:hypothetical protein